MTKRYKGGVLCISRDHKDVDHVHLWWGKEYLKKVQGLTPEQEQIVLYLCHRDHQCPGNKAIDEALAASAKLRAQAKRWYVRINK